VKSSFIAAAAILAAASLAAHAQDGPNIVPNASFESGLTDWVTFGNAFQNQEYASDGFSSLKMFGCFCSPYNAAGAVSTSGIVGQSGQVYRVSAQALTAGFDSIVGTQNWAGIKVEFRNSIGNVIGLAETRIIVGADPTQPIDTFETGEFLCVAPFGTSTINVVPVFLQADAADGGSVFIDNLSVAESALDPAAPVLNGGFDLGVDYSYQVFPTFNGWTEQYGNVFFDDAFYRSGPFSAGMYGSFPDYDGDGNCDPGGVSGLNQLIPGIGEGDVVTLSMAAMTPFFDTIVDTDNYVMQKIEFLGTNPNAPLDAVAGVVLDGAGGFDDDTWYESSISGTAPAGTLGIRIVAQIVQPNCGVGSVRIDDVMVTVGGEPPAPACTGDFNDDGVVNGADFGSLLAAWGACGGCDEDLNDDGFVNGADIGALLAAWGDCPDDNGGGGGGGGGDNCDEVHAEPGCTNAKCQKIVCALDPVCCEISWDEVCVDLATNNCP
jgi:hypothetical protein